MLKNQDDFNSHLTTNTAFNEQTKRRILREAEEHFSHYSFFFNPKDYVLDVGSGVGITQKIIKKQMPSLNFLGVDVFDYQIRDFPVLIYDGENIPLPDKCFDVGLLLYVLHHCKKPWQVLAETARTIKKGIVIIEEFDCPKKLLREDIKMERKILNAIGYKSQKNTINSIIEEGDLLSELQKCHLKVIKNEIIFSQTPRQIIKKLLIAKSNYV